MIEGYAYESVQVDDVIISSHDSSCKVAAIVSGDRRND